MPNSTINRRYNHPNIGGLNGWCSMDLANTNVEKEGIVKCSELSSMVKLNSFSGFVNVPHGFAVFSPRAHDLILSFGGDITF